VRDILSELEKPGRDPRPKFETAAFKEGVESMEDLKPGMILEGVVTNVANFGAFVDVGVHQDGLVHVSALANRYVKDPHDVVKPGCHITEAMHHRKEHLIRAVLEGVVFNLYSILPAVEALVGPSTSIQATGGFARSGLWRQMLADVFDRELTVPEAFESSCLGAVVLGLLALGQVKSLDVVKPMVGATHRHRPDPQAAAVYRRLLPIFLALPERLGEQYRAIAEFQREQHTPPA